MHPPIYDRNMVKYVRNSMILTGRVNDELVILDVEKGKYLGLNSVATRIWDLLEKEMDIEELCTILLEEYDVHPAECRTDVEQCIQQMLSESLISELHV